MEYFAKSTEEVFQDLKTSRHGLSEDEVRKRLIKFGQNSLPELEKVSFLKVLLRQIPSIFNLVLFIAAVISYFIGNQIDAWIIFGIIIVNVITGFIFEYRAERLAEKLKELIPEKTKVIRNGELKEIATEEVVPGDIVFLEIGDLVPADLRLFEVQNLLIDESILTGESLPIEKTAEPISQKTIALAEQKNMAFRGTTVFAGKGYGIIVATGEKTEIGKIAGKLKVTKKSESHFEYAIRQLVFVLGIISLAIALLIFLINLRNQVPILENLIFAIAALVAGVPEGLPIIVTLILALSALALVKENAIVKRLPVLESLSTVDLILTDKTQTLTEGKMVVKKIHFFDDEFEVTGEGFEPKGEFLQNGQRVSILEDGRFVKLMHISYFLPEARIYQGKYGEYLVKGDPTEGSLYVLALKSGLVENLQKEKLVKLNPFDQKEKIKWGIVEHNQKETLLVSGAFERIIQRSNQVFTKDGIKKLTQDEKEKLIKLGEEYAEKGFRVLGAAYKEEKIDLLQDFIFVALFAIHDPPKKEVEGTLQKLKQAGIAIKILTGDHRKTALGIASEVGLKGVALEEKALYGLPEKEFLTEIQDTTIFARVTPETKMKILEGYQKLGHRCAYIGDGVNDVLALKKAEIGISMGRRGTEIAREASDLILVDDDLETLVTAIKQGRKIFNNLRRTTLFLLATNLGEYLSIILVSLQKLPLILKPIHLLFINIITDTILGTSLAFEPLHGDELDFPPRKPKEKIISKQYLPLLILIGGWMAISAFIFFSLYQGQDLMKARTMAFTSIILIEILVVFNLRSLHESAFKMPFWKNKALFFGSIASFLILFILTEIDWLDKLLSLSTLTFQEWLLVSLVGLLAFLLVELYKGFKKKF